jgi:hypothetical protein
LIKQLDIALLVSTTHQDRSIQDLLNHRLSWIVWGVGDSQCIQCGSPSLLICKGDQAVFPADVEIVCAKLTHLSRTIDLPLALRNLIEDRFNYVKDQSLSSSSQSLAEGAAVIFGNSAALELGQPEPPLNRVEGKTSSTGNRPESGSEVAVAATPRTLDSGIGQTTTDRDNDFVPVPEGFRSIAWIREYEIRVLEYCYNNQTSHTIHNDKGEPIFKCTYFENETNEFRKFKANCQAVRIRKKGDRTIGWIKREEVAALMKAIRTEEDVDFLHTRSGNGGRVQFFPEGQLVAKRFRSTTRLLRRS